MSEVESVEEFRDRARVWLKENMPPEIGGLHRRIEEGRWARERELQRMLWDGGFAGICWPEEYGGLGLTVEHQRAFTEESVPYDMPYALNVPTFGILAATLIDCGTHEQKARHLPAILRGDELWVQFLSEPSGGSDLAGCLTRADRDGDVFVLNGSKIWSSGAAEADYAMILARTNWDLPKHRGLTMFILKIHQPGVTIERIKQPDGSMEFCQEFFDDVHIPEADIIGELDDGWNIASQLLVHERLAVGGGSPYLSGRWSDGDGEGGESNITAIAKELGRADDAHVRQLVAEAHVRTLVHQALNDRLTAGMTSGVVPPASGSIMKLFGATNTMRRAEIGVEIGATAVAVWPEPDSIGEGLGIFSLIRQGGSLGGGSNEIQRNIISERVLGMPREAAADREIPYRDVKRSGGK